MQRKYILLLVLLFCFCKEKKSKQFLLPQEPEPGIFWSYGELKSGSHVFLSQEVSWGTKIVQYENSFCLQSHSPELEALESGPILRICLAQEFQLKKTLEETVSFLHSAKDFYLQTSASTGKFAFQIEHSTGTKIQKRLEENPPEMGFWGESLFATPVELKENYFFLYGENKNIRSSFSLPYFSFFIWQDSVLLAFPPSHFKSGNKRDYLVIEFGNDPELIEMFRSFLLKISAKHESLYSDCNPERVILTEYFGSTSGYSVKFLELQNTSFSHVNCISEIVLHSQTQNLLFTNKPSFLFPGEIILFKEPESRTEGNIVENQEFWKEIKPRERILIEANEKTEIYNFLSFSFLQSDAEYSDQLQNISCENWGIFPKEKNICASPGISILRENFSNCTAKDFRLSELNSEGILYDQKLDRFGKFIELEQTTKESCELDLLYLEFTQNKIPIHLKKNISKSNLLLLGRKDYFLDIDLVDRNLSSLNWNEEIFLLDNSSKETIFVPPDFQFIPNSGKNKLLSMDVSNAELKHHKKVNSEKFRSDFQSENFMSPGEKNPTQPNVTGEIHFSEIQSYGAYGKDGSSLTTEKFLELENQGFAGSLRMQVTNMENGEKNNFMLYIEGSESFPIFSNTNLACSPNVNPTTKVDFPLKNEIQKWEIYHKEKKLDELTIYPAMGMGYEDRTAKIRKSYSRTKVSVWKNSTPVPNEFCGQLFGTPGESNQYAPFLQKVNHTNLWKYITHTTNTNMISLTIQTDPTNSQIFTIPLNKESIFSLPDITGYFPENSSLYLIPEKGEASIWNREKLYIAGVCSNPENSQNEWVLVCNFSEKNYNLQNYEIADNTHSDRILPFKTRFGHSPLQSEQHFDFLQNMLRPGACAYIIDPDATQLDLVPQGILPTLIFTVQSDSTIGNGISNSENLDLFQVDGSSRFFIHSYGNRFSGQGFSYNMSKNEAIYLQLNKEGNSLDEYDSKK